MTSDSSGIRVTRVGRDEPAAADRTDAPLVGGSTSRPSARETKPFFRTSEFLVAAGLVLALLVAGYAHDDSLNTWRTWLLITVIGSAYVLSRGVAKAGSADRR